MKKTSLFLLIIILSSNFLFAQTQQDSIDIVSIKWEAKKVKRGVVWKTAQVNLYGSPQVINILEVKPNRKNKLGIAYCVDTLIATSSLCKQVNAIAGVNASFFNMKDGGSVDYLKVDGKTVHLGRDAASSINSAIVVDGKHISIVCLSESNVEARTLNGSHVLAAGPMLVTSSAIESFPENSFNTTRHPRTCAAIANNGRILLVTVDGRHKDCAAGMSIKELAFLVKVLGAKDAMNFDGGGSTAMYVKGEGESGIVSYPSDNKTFNHLGERRVANVVYVK